ncbi:Aste57867_15424 [Aphanomyces stellatus]|uniref:Aste57867_15424 protein n=1 Tax=Aphanomyces stellatus TaxID=120398 RepID=A0A485L3N1_9STRA|nr:hypothetical protein As57867_015368 [Aphanomyces stellatus]VFT92226.1 Aste57867_15424 [Aphanomyces stellatus]
MRPESRKCVYHRKKGICAVVPCRNQVNKRGLCLAHGARTDPCSVLGCTIRARSRGLCFSHSKCIKSAPSASEPLLTYPLALPLDGLLYDTDFDDILSGQYIKDVPWSLPLCMTTPVDYLIATSIGEANGDDGPP